MQYDMIPLKTVNRLWDTFQGHSACVNEKYEAFKSETTYWTSDRERFVGRFFKKYAGKYVAFADKLLMGYKTSNSFFLCEATSVFAPKQKSLRWHDSSQEPLFREQKVYLQICGFGAVNELYGVGYIEMQCVDALGNLFRVRLDHNNLMYIQFKEITKLEFDTIAGLFKDDRDTRPYRVKRYMVHETTSKRGKKKQEVVMEEVTVMARDADEARDMLTNVLSVEREEPNEP